MELKVTAYSVEEQIATLRLHRPGRGNAWTGRMTTEYRYCLQRADEDDGVRAIVVTGTGDSFSVGADTRALERHAAAGEYDAGTPPDMPTPGYGIAPEFDANFAFHFGLQKPVIAAINGGCAGIALAAACFADLRFAAAGAKLTTAHGKLNLPAEFGLSWLLPRMVGITAANDLLLSSRVFRAEEALALRLVNRVVPREHLLAETYAYTAEMIRTVSPESLRATKRQIYLDWHRSVAASVEDSERLIRQLVTQPNYGEGVRAFLEKRPPAWHPIQPDDGRG